MKYLKLLVILFFTTTIFSQSISNNTNLPFIEVTGKAETEIVPDEIYIDIRIKESVTNGKKLTIDFLETKLKNQLDQIEIPKENLSISDVNAVLSKTGWWKEEFLSIANYTLKVNGANKLKKLFEVFKKLNISEVNITRATHSNIIEIRKKNRIKAIKVAKEKADYLLNSIGEKTGKPIIVKETTNDNQNFSNANYVNQSRSYELKELVVIGYGNVKNKIVQFEKIKISSSIYVKFQIK